MYPICNFGHMNLSDNAPRSLLKEKPSSSLTNLPPLPPASTRLENNTVLRQESRSAVALAELRMWLQQHHNPNIFLDNIMMREAIHSTAVETRLVSIDNVLEALTVQSMKPTAVVRHALHCFHALRIGSSVINQSKKLELGHIFKIVAQLQGLNHSAENAHGPYDEHSHYIRLLQNLVIYFNEPIREISPLIRMAVQHYQFESIHPFYLENGRTGRVLNLLFLRQHNLLPYPMLSLSEYILQNKIEYYHLYQQVREQDEWTSWILFLLRGLESVARKISNQLLATETVYKSTTELCRREARSIYTKPLIDLIFQRPYCKIEYLQEFNIAHRKAAGKYLHTLKELGILEVRKFGKENIFIHQAVMNLLQF